MEPKRSVECGTMWRKEGYHGDYSKSPVLPDDKDDITEYIELFAMLDDPGKRTSEARNDRSYRSRKSLALKR